MKKSYLRPKLSDVARKAGVGTTTVSRAINGGHRVSPETLMRIRAVIKQLGYFPNQAAQSLKGRGSKTLGLIIPSISDPFFSSCAEAVEKVARSHECLLIVAASN